MGNKLLLRMNCWQPQLAAVPAKRLTSAAGHQHVHLS